MDRLLRESCLDYDAILGGIPGVRGFSVVIIRRESGEPCLPAPPKPSSLVAPPNGKRFPYAAAY
jgi:hypothetical protein